MVVLAVGVEHRNLARRTLDVELTDGVGVDAFDEGFTGKSELDVADLAVFVVFGGQLEGLGLQPKVDVLGDQGDHSGGVFLLQLEGGVENAVVVGLGAKYLVGFAVLAFLVQDDFELPAFAVVDVNPILKGLRFAQAVNDADTLARLEILGFIPHLELVEFL